MIKNLKEYLNTVTSLCSECDKKIKRRAFLFTFLVGVLLIVPVFLVLLNIFFQYGGIKIVVYSAIVIIGILVHVYLAVITPIYYLSIETLSNDESLKISYKKLFLSFLLDYVSFIIITIFSVIICFIISFIFF